MGSHCYKVVVAHAGNARTIRSVYVWGRGARTRSPAAPALLPFVLLLLVLLLLLLLLLLLPLLLLQLLLHLCCRLLLPRPLAAPAPQSPRAC